MRVKNSFDKTLCVLFHCASNIFDKKEKTNTKKFSRNTRKLFPIDIDMIIASSSLVQFNTI